MSDGISDPMNTLKDIESPKEEVKINDNEFIILPNNLTKYIRKSNKKVGAIRAHKIQLTPGDKAVVFITHAKAHSKMDKFNKSMMTYILDNRCLYMYKILYYSKNIRVKDINSCPQYLKRLYMELEERSRKYFRDCNEIYSYINMFDYVDYNNPEGI
jgi:hypothetical protein